ncbi:MAG: EAL domain-containing protein [Cyanobacteria bacterium SBC]|nr:EAL domain-containing protein [Cyanobacteria bacterium SBC]
MARSRDRFQTVWLVAVRYARAGVVKARPWVAALERPLQKFKHPIIGVHVAVTALMFVAQTLGGFEGAELAAFDRAMRRTRASSPSSMPVIVAVTESDLSEYQWPLSDAVLARVFEILQRHSPRAIGLDVYRNVTVREGREELQQQLAAPNAIVIRSIESPSRGGTPPPANVPAEQIGFNDIPLDRDDVVRRQVLFATTPDGEVIFSFAIRLALLYLQKSGIEPKPDPQNPDFMRLGETTLSPLNSTAGGYRYLDSAGYQILLDYRQQPKQLRTISIDEVLNEQFDPQWIRDRVVLIGSVAPSLRDLFVTPFSAVETESQLVKMSGVELHARMVQQSISIAQGDRAPWWYAPDWLEAIWVWLWISIGTLLAWRVRRPVYLGGFTILTLGGLWLLEIGAFAASVWLPVVWVRTGFLAGIASTIVYRLLDDALHDRLTRLPNRTLLLNQLRLLRKRYGFGKRGVGAIYLDLDRFKAINDCLGRTIGDCMLVEVAERLKTCLSAKDFLARVGSDEFVMVLDNTSDLDDLMEVALQVRRKLKRPFVLTNGQPVFVTASIGVALGTTGDERDPIEDAHTAMYRAKALKKPYPEVFDPSFQNQSIARFQLEIDLRQSMTHSQVFSTPIEQLDWNAKEDSNMPHSELGEEFRVYYQPLVRLSSGRIAGFEALVRWQHPNRGFVSPGQFIPVMEEMGSIVPLGAWVLERACAQTRLWQRQFPSRYRTMVSVNLSAKQLQSPDLFDRVAQILSRTRLNPRCLKLEITESVVMDDVESMLAVLQRLKALNVRLSIDDFGTGYSSLSYLNRFPIDTLKVDRSFVQQMEQTRENREIVRTIVSLAHTLGMDTIAEGIETPEQLAHLREIGCDYGQGYWFAKPLPASSAAQLLARRPQW